MLGHGLLDVPVMFSVVKILKSNFPKDRLKINSGELLYL